MSHKNAPPLTAEQIRFETYWQAEKRQGFVGYSRDQHGYYHTEFLRDAWNAWQAAIGSSSTKMTEDARSCPVPAEAT